MSMKCDIRFVPKLWQATTSYLALPLGAGALQAQACRLIIAVNSADTRSVHLDIVWLV